MYSKNYPNNQERHIPISNNRPTLVIAYVSGPISCKECTWLLCKWVRHSMATRQVDVILLKAMVFHPLKLIYYKVGTKPRILVFSNFFITLQGSQNNQVAQLSNKEPNWYLQPNQRSITKYTFRLAPCYQHQWFLIMQTFSLS